MNAPSQYPLLLVRQLHVNYPLPARWPWHAPLLLKAVEGVNFDLESGETLGVVGESGCGKSTLARALVGLQPAASGAVILSGRDITRLDDEARRQVRREIQLVFQDPLASLDPRMTVGEIVSEPLENLCPELGEVERRERVMGMLERVGLRPDHINRYPPAANASASALRARWWCGPRCWCAMKPSARWTCRSAPRSSRCCRNCRKKWVWA
jgi:oligopeptide transport system ATP-binding protein